MLRGIELSVVWLPALAFAAALVPVLFYGRFERLEPQMQAELEKRRTAG